MKNKLQETLQKNGLPLPQYDHTPYHMGWQSILTLYNGKTFKGLGLSKKEADNFAAGYALDTLSFTKVKKITVDCLNTIVLINLQNLPNLSFSNVVCHGGCIEAFVQKHSTFATSDLRDRYPFVHQFHIINSKAPDAVDHAIAFRAGQICDPTMETLIVSQDKFAIALTEVLLEQQFQCKHYANLDEFVYDYQKI